MIKVDSSFYENGFIMDGEGNRVFLKTKEGKVETEMVFIKNKVIIHEPGVESVFDFKEITGIYVEDSEWLIKKTPFVCIEFKR